MAATTLSAKTSTNSLLLQLVGKLKHDYPSIKFKPSDQPRWSAKQQTIFYDTALPEKLAITSLLHELGHAKLGHADYISDFELLRMETEAWSLTTELASTYSAELDQEHIQDCLDTYRDWLYQRSLCPSCTSQGLQKDRKTYKCVNCGLQWQVSPSRFSRPYRQVNRHKKD